MDDGEFRSARAQWGNSVTIEKPRNRDKMTAAAKYGCWTTVRPFSLDQSEVVDLQRMDVKRPSNLVMQGSGKVL